MRFVLDHLRHEVLDDVEQPLCRARLRFAPADEGEHRALKVRDEVDASKRQLDLIVIAEL